MKVEQTKTIKMNDEEMAIIRDSAKVLDDLNYMLEDGEDINIEDVCYGKNFIDNVVDFLCDLRGCNNLIVEKRKSF